MIVKLIVLIVCIANLADGYRYKRTINLYWWQDANIIEYSRNFGDNLSPILVKRILENKYPEDEIEIQRVEHGTPNKKKVLAIGSIIQFASTGDVIWGSGINGGDLDHRSICVFIQPKLQYKRSLRGQLSQKFLEDVSHIEPDKDIPYGDPALLFPQLFPEFKKDLEKQDFDFLLIPHYYEYEYFIGKEKQYRKQYSKLNFKIIDVLNDPYDQIIRDIIQSKKVISSSLHGIIVSEAYQIPAIFIRPKDRIPKVFWQVESLFKYQDYYSGTNRNDFFIANDLQSALVAKPNKRINFNAKSLLESFPYDLVESELICQTKENCPQQNNEDIQNNEKTKENTRNYLSINKKANKQFKPVQSHK